MQTNNLIEKEVVPMAAELADDELDNLFGAAIACGCGWWCTLTAECNCESGRSLCISSRLACPQA